MSFRSGLRLVVSLVVLAGLYLSVSAATAALPDRRPPTTPTNLRVTAKTQTSVSLAWNPSTDNSGNFTYRVNQWVAPGPVPLATLPKTETTYTVTGLIPNVQYFFWVDAIDASGNKSTSNQVTVTTNKDTTPPSAPANLRVISVTSSQIALAWDPATDNTGIREYLVAVTPQNGAFSWTSATSVTIISLPPETTFSFSVRAKDHGYNTGPVSETVSATTLPTTDTHPPTAPTNLSIQNWDCEVELKWTQSTDNQDPQSAIRYKVFINGQPDATVIGLGRAVTYGIVDGNNTFVLRAVDSAGNVSGPSNAVTRVLDC